MSDDGHHHGDGAKPAAPSAAPAPMVVQPFAVAAPQVMAPGLCRCGLAPSFLVCACVLKPEEKKADPPKPHAPAGPPAPAFSSAVPADFPKRFEYVWSALGKVLEGKAPPHGVIADARALLDLLLDELDPEGRGRFVTEGAWWWKKTTFKTYGPKQRLHKLVDKRILLKSVKETVDRLAWTPEEQAARGVRGDPDLAKRLVHLVWQVADQGFEQRSWSELAEAPPRVQPAAAGHDDHGHGGGDGGHH